MKGGDGGEGVLLIAALIFYIGYQIGKLFKEKLNVSTIVAVILAIISIFVIIFLSFTLYMWYTNSNNNTTVSSTTN
jgi:predicted PurR-regulated permease PerM